MASLEDTKLNPRASSALIFMQVLIASCILTWGSKGKNGITQAGDDQRKPHCPLCNPLPPPIAHLTPSILAAEPGRLEK